MEMVTKMLGEEVMVLRRYTDQTTLNENGEIVSVYQKDNGELWFDVILSTTGEIVSVPSTNCNINRRNR